MPLIPPVPPPPSSSSSIYPTILPSSSSNKPPLPIFPIRECPSCKETVSDEKDKFCRSCGLRILMHCSKCSNPVRPSDKFCGSCGAKRWKLLEFWRYGILHRSPAFVLGIAGATIVGYLGLLLYLRRRAGRLA